MTNVQLVEESEIEVFLNAIISPRSYISSYRQQFPRYFLILLKALALLLPEIKGHEYMAAPDMRICARASVFDREFAIGLFRYKSFAANKGLYPKKRRITEDVGSLLAFPGRGRVDVSPVLQAFNWDFIRRIRLKGHSRRIV